MNGSTGNLTGGNTTVFETFWPCFFWHTENNMEYDLAVSSCSHLPTPFLHENKKVGIASASVGTVALLMNVVVLSGVLKNHQLSKPMYMFVANLAVADCVAGLFSFFFCACFQLELLPPRTMMGLYCTFFLVLVSSAVGVVLLSGDRYLSIIHPIFYQTRMSGRHVAVSLAIAWPACVLVCLSPLMGWNCYSDTETCLTISVMPASYVILINTILLTAVVIVVFVNVRIFIELKQRFSRTRPPENPQDNLPAARRREQRVAARQYRQLQTVWKMQVTVVIIAAVFIIFWLPICIGSVRQLVCFARADCETKARPYWGFLIALCNSVVNPVIYALRIKKIREAAHCRARRFANAVREKLGWSSNRVVNIQIVGNTGTMDAVAGPSTDNPTDQPPKWAVSRRVDPRKAPSSGRVGDSGTMDAVAGPSTDNRTDRPPKYKWAVSRKVNPRNVPSSSA